MPDPSTPPRYLVAHPGAEMYGSDRVMLESVVAMIEAGAAVTVVLPESGPLVLALERAGARVRVAPAFVLRKRLLRPRHWPELARSAVQGWHTARAAIRGIRPDAVYVSTVTLPLWPVAARLAGVPVLVHVHEAEQAASRWVKRGMYAPVRTASDVVVNSEFSRHVLAVAYPSTAERAVVVYNGVVGPASPTPARERLTAPVRLVYVGRLSPRKGPDAVVDALALLPDDLPEVHLDIVGAVFDGYEWFEEALRSRIVELGLSDRVRLLGFREDIWDLVDAGDALVVPSRLDEPFGNTAVEGVLAGRAVLASDTSGLREATAGAATAHRFAPDDPQALADAVAATVRGWDDIQPHLASDAAVARERFSPARYRADIAARMAALSGSRPASARRRRSSRGTT